MKMLIIILAGSLLFVGGCGEDGNTLYNCSYQSRHTACGGGDWTAWESACYQFDMDDYLDDWTPQRVCDKFSGSDTECSATCCINVEYQNNQLASGTCI